MSSWKQNLTKKLPEHKHCPVCGISIPVDKEFCSIECRDKYQGYEKKKNRNNYIQMALIFGILAVTMILMPLLQGG
ncbi:MAG: DUF2116 family Zn-ribbon domain-containing protein [Promethearchaeota archaeon]